MSSGSSVTTALELARQLKIVLGEEFAALAADDLAQFEKLGEAKSELITQLDRMTRHSPVQEDPAWSDFRSEMLSCKTLHRRNETLLRAKLETIRGALQLLQKSADSDGAMDLYDRLGRVSQSTRRRPIADA